MPLEIQVMRQMQRSKLIRYAIAVGAPLIALGLSLLFKPLIERFQLIFFFAAVIFSASFGGIISSLITAVISVFLADVFILSAYNSFYPKNADLIILAIFLVIGGLTGWAYERRYKAEKQAAEDRESLSTILTSIGDGVIVTDTDSRVTMLNHTAELLTGWKQQDTGGQTISTIFHIINEDTRKEVDNPLLRVFREGVIVGLANHTILIAKDGREIPIDDSGAPVKNKAGAITGAVLVFHDISERRNAEHRATTLQNVTTALSGAINISDVARIFVDIALKAVGASGGGVVRLIDADTLEAVEIANYSPSLVQNWQKFSVHLDLPLAESVRTANPIWIDSREQWSAQYMAPISADYQSWATVPLIVKGQTIGGIALSFATPRQFSEQDKSFIMALAAEYAQALDRTLIYEAEQRARGETEKAKQRVEFLNQASQLLSSALDFDTTFKNLRSIILPQIADIYAIDMVQPDKSVCRVAMSAFEPDVEALVHELEALSDPNLILNSGSFQAGKSILIAQVPPSLLESVARDADHLALLKKVDVSSEILAPLRVRETNIGILAVVRRSSQPAYTNDDVAMVEELAHRAAQAIENARLFVEAQQAIKLRDEFLSVAAHELKTPVTSMQGFSQVLQRRISKGGTIAETELTRSLGLIEQQSIKLTRLIGHLLDVSRIESGRLVLEKDAVDISRLIRTTVETMQRNSYNHVISVDAPDTLIMKADSLRLEQVLINLLDNAVKFSPDGGPIRVSVTKPEAQQVTITVSDSGIGIPAEHRQSLFDRFYQAHEDGYKGGMGLGLYISNQIVGLHGGSLHAEFPTEGGTQFIITLPVS
jgi:PAS domain S-box-containing protein